MLKSEKIIINMKKTSTVGQLKESNRRDPGLIDIKMFSAVE